MSSCPNNKKEDKNPPHVVHVHLPVSIQVRGLGHKISITLPPSDTLSSLQNRIEDETGLPPGYQRLIIRGKTLTGDGDLTPLQQLGLLPGSKSKAILMHSPTFGADRGSMEQLTKLNLELDMLELKKKGEGISSGSGSGSGNTPSLSSSRKQISKAEAQNLITNICCKLDEIDLHGSNTLREIRRKIFKRAENLDQLWEDNE